MARRCWDCHWAERVMHNSEMSTCVSRHVGAVLIRNNRVIADGFNGNLPGHPHCDQGGCARCNAVDVTSGADLARCVCVHAEENIFSYCAENGIATAGSTLVVSCTPCMSCARLAISSGVVEVVYAELYAESDAAFRQMAELSMVKIRDQECSC